MRILRKISIAAALSIGRAFTPKSSDNVVGENPCPVEQESHRFYASEVTVAGGPGAQNIGDAFDALPEDVRTRMKLERKGKVRPERADDSDDSSEHVVARTERINRGLVAAMDRAYGRDASGKLYRKQDTGE